MTNPPTEPHSLSGAVIRPAVIADAPAIRGIRNAAVRDSLAIWTSQEQDPDEAAAWLEPRIARGTALVIAGDSGRFSTSPSCPGGSTGRDSAEPRHPASCGSPSR